MKPELIRTLQKIQTSMSWVQAIKMFRLAWDEPLAELVTAIEQYSPFLQERGWSELDWIIALVLGDSGFGYHLMASPTWKPVQIFGQNVGVALLQMDPVSRVVSGRRINAMIGELDGLVTHLQESGIAPQRTVSLIQGHYLWLAKEVIQVLYQEEKAKHGFKEAVSTHLARAVAEHVLGMDSLGVGDFRARLLQEPARVRP